MTNIIPNNIPIGRLKPNFVTLADAYKYTHYLQLDNLDIDELGGYIEARGTSIEVDYTRFFGLQGFILDYLQGPVLEQWMIDEASELLGEVFGTSEYFNRAGFERLLKKHGGHIPIEIRAVKEGTRLPLKNVMVTVRSTDKEFAWLEPWIETMLLRGVWYGTTVCTVSSAMKDIERHYAEICGANLNPFMLNDFGARGVSSHESAEIGGSAHLVNGLGTDTVEAIRWAKNRYGATASGHSVFASEHSTTTITGRDGEKDRIRHFLSKLKPNQIGSFVGDSYSISKFIKQYICKDFRDIILARTAPIVVRPDSGDPVEMAKDAVSWLWDGFGGTTNEKGYNVLNPAARIIYGDSLSLKTSPRIYQNLIDHKFSIENIMLGMGGKLLQVVDRDTFKFALKLSYAIIDGQEIEVYKDPDTDIGKQSKKGRLKLIKIDGQYKTVKVEEYPDIPDELETVFLNGQLTRFQTFQEIREIAAND